MKYNGIQFLRPDPFLAEGITFLRHDPDGRVRKFLRHHTKGSGVLGVGHALAHNGRITGGSGAVPPTATLLLNRLFGQQMATVGAAVHDLAATRNLEALGNGFLGFLHGNFGKAVNKSPLLPRCKA